MGNNASLKLNSLIIKINNMKKQYTKVIKLLKLQACERMYSKEDMINFAEFVASYPDKNKNVFGNMLHAKSKYDGAETTDSLLGEFNKRTR